MQQIPVITASQKRLFAFASANALITGMTAMDSKLESVIVSVQANVAQTVAGVGKIVGRPSKNLPLGDAGHKQVLSGIH